MNIAPDLESMSKPVNGLSKELTGSPDNAGPVDVNVMRVGLPLLFADVWQSFGLRLPALVFLMTVAALGEGLSMALFIPLLSSLGIGDMSGGSAPTGTIGAMFHRLGENASPTILLAVILIVLVVQTAISLGQVWYTASLQRQYGALIQRRLFGAIMNANWPFFASQKVGDLVSAMTDEVDRARGAFFAICQIFSAILAAVVYFGIALALSWKLTVAVLVFGAVLIIPMRVLGYKNYRIGMRLGPLNAQLHVLLNELLGGAKLVKATASEDKANRLVGAVIEDIRIENTWATFLPGFVRNLLEFLAIVALALVLVVGYMLFAIPGAEMFVVMALFARLLPRMNAVLQLGQMLAIYMPAVESVHRLLSKAKSFAEPASEGLVQDLPRGHLTAQIKSAGYSGKPILRDVNITLPEKGFVGIVGESGAGKSTLVNCLFGLCPLISGVMILGSREINTVPLPVWRRAFGYVPQETVLFNLSVRDNIAWIDEGAGLEEVIAAAKKANAHSFIEALPRGYDTHVGDHGMVLSGGQRQRLGIARSLIRRPSVLVLDEATSALDSSSEASILETLEQLRSEICIVSVAHRLSSVRGADCIYVMHEGTVVEQGNWDDLIAMNGRLTTLARAQGLI